MSLDKAIAHGKERRRGFRGSASFDVTCRNHGSCGRCRGNRLFSLLKVRAAAKDEFKDWQRGVA